VTAVLNSIEENFGIAGVACIVQVVATLIGNQSHRRAVGGIGIGKFDDGRRGVAAIVEDVVVYNSLDRGIRAIYSASTVVWHDRVARAVNVKQWEWSAGSRLYVWRKEYVSGRKGRNAAD
jgi:hypothetical protein